MDYECPKYHIEKTKGFRDGLTSETIRFEGPTLTYKCVLVVVETEIMEQMEM